jgi:hypothetical protein
LAGFWAGKSIKMKSIVYSFRLILFIILFSSCAEKQDLSDIAWKQANELADAMVNGDVSKVAEFVHPNMLKLYGGKENFIQQLQEDLKADPYRYLSIEVEHPDEIISTENSFQCIFYQETIVYNGEQKLISTTPLFGISNKEGNQWYFVQLSDEIEKLKRLIPEISDKIKIDENRLKY